MKKLLCLLAIFAMTACSSTDEAEEAAASAEATAAEAAAATEAAATEAVETVKEAPAEAMEKTEEVTSSGTDFPPITGTEKSSASCSNGGDTRKVAVLNVTEGGCGVVYTKAGSDKTIAMAKHDMSFCDKVSDNVKANLEGAGFDCGGGSSAPAEEAPAAESSSTDAPAAE